MSVLALIPARSGSKGIPGKNFRPLAGLSPVDLAIRCAEYANIEHIVVSTDVPDRVLPGRASRGTLVILPRPTALALDDTPMIDVVQHALREIPGPEDEIILLLQPTAYLRQVSHLHACLRRLRETGADSVVTVIEVTPPAKLLRLTASGELWPWGTAIEAPEVWWAAPEQRQRCTPAYQRDGSCYAFWRRTVTTYGSIYGAHCLPVVVPQAEHGDLDTPADWADAERRLGDRWLSGQAPHCAYDHDDAEADG